MDKQGFKKSSTASNASKVKEICINNNPAKISNLIQKKSSKSRRKYTKLFEIYNLSDKPNTRAHTVITQISPGKALASQQEKCVYTTDFSTSSNDSSKKVSEKKIVQVEPEINNKKEDSTHSLGKSSKKATSMIKQPKNVILTSKNKPTESTNLNQQKSGKRRSKYTKLFEMCNLSDKPNISVCTMIKQTSPEKALISQREKSLNTTDFTSSSVVLTKKISEKTKVQVGPEINKKKGELTHELGKSSTKTSSMAEQSKKTVLTTENNDKEMFKICLTIVDEFLKQARADKNLDKKISTKKNAQKSMTSGQIASNDVKKRKSPGATNASKEKKISINDKPANSSNLNQKKSGKIRCKYTKLFEMCNLSDRPNTRAPTPIRKTRPENVLTSQREKSVNTNDFSNITNVLSKKVPDETMVQMVPNINDNEKISNHALEKSSIKASSMAKQPKKTVLTTENNDKEMFKMCLTIVDEFSKQVRADNNANEKITNKKKALQSTKLSKIACEDVNKKPVTTICQSLDKVSTAFDEPGQSTEEEKQKESEKKKSKNSRKKMKKLIKLSEENKAQTLSLKDFVYV